MNKFLTLNPDSQGCIVLFSGVTYQKGYNTLENMWIGGHYPFQI